MSSADWAPLLQARRGDQQAWQQLVDMHFQRLVDLGCLLTGSVAAGQDVAQETLVRAVTSRLRHLDGTAHGYLTTIAYRLAVKERARSRRSVVLDDEAPDGQGAAADWLAVAGERQAAVIGALDRLAPEERSVLVLRFYGDLSYEQIARAVGAPVGTVKSRMFRAMQSCRRQLAAMGDLL